LVVIAIIGILVALLLPAIQAAREAARRAQCKNNLRQIAQACLNHESAHRFFPYGGWSFGWMGDPDQGYGPQQPGGWIYAIGPYLEEQAVFNLGKGLEWNQKKVELSKQMSAVVPVFNCPSRRSGYNQPAKSPDGRYCEGGDNNNLKNANVPETLAKTDYVINAGARRLGGAGGSGGAPSADCLQPITGEEGVSPGSYPICDFHIDPKELPGILQSWDGISTHRAGAKMSQITDGASQTALVGEKFVMPRFYEGNCEDTGSNPSKGNGGDNNSMYQGYDPDNARSGSPVRDEDDLANGWGRFGSAHAGGIHLALCDGSVQTVDYDTEPGVWGGYIKRNNSQFVSERPNYEGIDTPDN
jgi:hypothetical protein